VVRQAKQNNTQSSLQCVVTCLPGCAYTVSIPKVKGPYPDVQAQWRFEKFPGSAKRLTRSLDLGPLG
jgi:hypothetical protein